MTARAPLPLPRALTDRYRIIGECGHGATSVVYRARDEGAGREVAVKVLRGEVASTVGAERFLREVRIVAAIRHPNIVSLLDSGEAEGVLYCVLSFVNGETLRQRMAREGPLPVAEALRLLDRREHAQIGGGEREFGGGRGGRGSRTTMSPSHLSMLPTFLLRYVHRGALGAACHDRGAGRCSPRPRGRPTASYLMLIESALDAAPAD